jgi:hypothetical protein
MTMTGRRLATLALLALLTPLPTRALAARGQSLNLSAGVSSAYDDNFMQFSDHQLTDFDSGLHPLRYSVQSTGDALFLPEAALTWRLDDGGGRRHTLRLRWEGDFHSRNGTADNNAASVRWTEFFAKDRRLTAGWYRLNNFYVRQLRDEDLDVTLGELRYQRAQFDLSIYSAAWRQRLARSMLADFAYQFEDRTYAPGFIERTSGTHQGELRLDWDRLPHRADIEARFGWRDSQADATDGDEVGGVREDDDVSYHGPEGGISGRMEFRRAHGWRWGGDLGWEMESRAYDSDLPTDPYHFGRNDLLNAVEAGVRLGYRRHWTARVYYRLENNVANLGVSAPPSSDSGSYRENRVGLELNWSGLVWRQATAQDESEE